MSYLNPGINLDETTLGRYLAQGFTAYTQTRVLTVEDLEEKHLGSTVKIRGLVGVLDEVEITMTGGLVDDEEFSEEAIVYLDRAVLFNVQMDEEVTLNPRA